MASPTRFVHLFGGSPNPLPQIFEGTLHVGHLFALAPAAFIGSRAAREPLGLSAQS